MIINVILSAKQGCHKVTVTAGKGKWDLLFFRYLPL